MASPSTQTIATTTMPQSSNKRSIEELVKDLSGTGITRVTPTTAMQFSTKDFLKKSLYGDSTNNNHGGRMQNVHSIFAAGLERRRRAAQLGYGDDVTGEEQPQRSSSDAEPQPKRRRFQRRNSKTPAMLFKSMNFLPQDLFSEDDTNAKPVTAEATAKPSTAFAKQEDEDDWDGGLEIAEQLVKHLQKRRQSDASVTAH